ncbi:hypothetical protein [Sphingomonas mesophila]|uniref:hypothetical protein n=1 Tax=Sphingomonas mesophila TaxID=2303576 RepID=UPI0013C2EA0E|nr:hypothetical protein [Sphingomonas mesophila]
MRFRIPQPIHGWRQFAGEVGIIVVGVLIALGAQQIVEDRSWAGQIKEARTSLDAQLIDSKYAAMERVASAWCVERRLDFFDEVVAGRRPAAGLDTKVSPLRLWGTSAWDAATASGAVARMPAALRNDYAGLFSFSEALNEINSNEFSESGGLGTLERHGNLTDVSRDRLAETIARMRTSNRILKLGAQQWLEGAKPLNLSEEGFAEDLAKAKQCKLPDGTVITKGAA